MLERREFLGLTAAAAGIARSGLGAEHSPRHRAAPAFTSVPIRPARSGPSARRCRPCIDRFSTHDDFDPRLGGSEVHRHIKNHALVVEESKLTIDCTFEITVRPHLPPELVHVAREEMDVGMTWGLIAQTDLEVQDRNLAPETVEKYAAGRLTGRSQGRGRHGEPLPDARERVGDVEAADEREPRLVELVIDCDPEVRAGPRRVVDCPGGPEASA